jgi:hypothetical protein
MDAFAKHTGHSAHLGIARILGKVALSVKVDPRTISGMDVASNIAHRSLFGPARDAMRNSSSTGYCTIGFDASSQWDERMRSVYDSLPQPNDTNKEKISTDYSKFDRRCPTSLILLGHLSVFMNSDCDWASNNELWRMYLGELASQASGFAVEGTTLLYTMGGVRSGNARTADGNSRATNMARHASAVMALRYTSQSKGDTETARTTRFMDYI